MNWKDTVISDELVEEKYNCTKTRNSSHYALVLSIAKTQAPISFKAGRKEVVEFVLAHKETSLFNKHGNVYIDPDEWQAKLKDWGLE